jgi:hypothetical protein
MELAGVAVFAHETTAAVAGPYLPQVLTLSYLDPENGLRRNWARYPAYAVEASGQLYYLSDQPAAEGPLGSYGGGYWLSNGEHLEGPLVFESDSDEDLRYAMGLGVGHTGPGHFQLEHLGGRLHLYDFERRELAAVGDQGWTLTRYGSGLYSSRLVICREGFRIWPESLPPLGPRSRVSPLAG